MKKLNILLCCGSGMSSGFLAQKARKAAKKRGIDIQIEAKSETEAASYFSKIDALLLGPHYESYKEEFTKLGSPYDVVVEVIPQKIYGILDGDQLIDFAINLINESKGDEL